MTEFVDEVKLLAVREGNYTVYVFRSNLTDKYIMCTRLPNWQSPKININDEGFLQYQIVKAGEEYFNPNTQEKIKFNYSNVYFNNFVKKSDCCGTEIII